MRSVHPGEVLLEDYQGLLHLRIAHALRVAEKVNAESISKGALPQSAAGSSHLSKAA
jgi:hypothetical protein